MAALELLGVVPPEVDDARGVFGTDLVLVNLILPNVQYFARPGTRASTRACARMP